jgi:hypothetical protein
MYKVVLVRVLQCFLVSKIGKYLSYTPWGNHCYYIRPIYLLQRFKSTFWEIKMQCAILENDTIQGRQETDHAYVDNSASKYSLTGIL